MVVKMMRWRPWPPLISRKYEVKLTVQSLEGCDWVPESAEKDNGGLAVEIRWKGPGFQNFPLLEQGSSIQDPHPYERTNHTPIKPNEIFASPNLVQGNCLFSTRALFYLLNSFHFVQGLNQGAKNKVAILGSAVLNLAEFASKIEEQEIELKIPLAVSGNAAGTSPLLRIFLSLLELRASQESTELVQRQIVPISSPSPTGETSSSEKDEVSALKAGLRKVKMLTDYVSNRRAKKACREEEGSDGRGSAKSEEGDYTYNFDSDSLDEFEEGQSDEAKDNTTVRKSFSYGTLAYANYAGVSYYSSARINCEDEDWIYYSYRKSDINCSHKEDPVSTVSESSLLQNSKRSILPWRKRKLSFRSPKVKGEPLLKKAYGEEGGDDIDYDRRQLSSDESLSFGWHKTDEDSNPNRTSVSEFGDDSFAVGSWEQNEITSRDGRMKIQTQVFFATIDQRSERAAGESACTALVTVIADWLQKNRDLMPIKSQFDCLIRDGSLEWRNLCENETYRVRFPDKHFDLETVLQAKVCDLGVVPGKSFIGFFHPDEMEEGNFDFLHGAMSFDNIWDEISRSACFHTGEAPVFIVSWNDHFFVLKVEADAYYIIDTLGERLYEGCNQAYILKFDRHTTIYKLPSMTQLSEEKIVGDKPTVAETVESKNSSAQHIYLRDDSKDGTNVAGREEPMKNEEEVVCSGKESCKEYIKSFLAAIPIRELQADIKKGLITSTPVHHRLQIEFHFTTTTTSYHLNSTSRSGHIQTKSG
ncbi:Hypothetical predicted protein [Olea europaea subsp. europaea]|uniref:C2 NT-type domain-containing protein n=2 Tax=Olea europaea subsp. europaea TaxID=158383 RepID=A0A8S0TN16_OLEEU|nr:Hypothetical predicted protein [Olea europaea subsp. europaea]